MKTEQSEFCSLRENRSGRAGERFLLALGLGILVFAGSGCAWVKVNPGAAENVRVISRATAQKCQRVGTTNARTKAALGFLKRNPETVGEELATLARNDAPGLGGDAVVAETPIDLEGQQRFGVYDCSSGWPQESR